MRDTLCLSKKEHGSFSEPATRGEASGLVARVPGEVLLMDGQTNATQTTLGRLMLRISYDMNVWRITASRAVERAVKSVPANELGSLLIESWRVTPPSRVSSRVGLYDRYTDEGETVLRKMLSSTLTVTLSLDWQEHATELASKIPFGKPTEPIFPDSVSLLKLVSETAALLHIHQVAPNQALQMVVQGVPASALDRLFAEAWHFLSVSVIGLFPRSNPCPTTREAMLRGMLRHNLATMLALTLS